MSHLWDIALGLVVISNVHRHEHRRSLRFSGRIRTMHLTKSVKRNGIKALLCLCMLGAGAAYAAAPAWQPDVFYAAGTLVTYNGSTYSALVNQTDYTATGWN